MTFDTNLTEEDFIKAGYKKQYNGLVRKLGRDGRFHAKIKFNKRNKFVDIHFDLWKEDKNSHPSVFPMPELLGNEMKRIESQKTIQKIKQ